MGGGGGGGGGGVTYYPISILEVKDNLRKVHVNFTFLIKLFQHFSCFY